MLTQSLRPADRADTPADSNGPALFSERRNLVSAHGPSRSARAITVIGCPFVTRESGGIAR
jgi:hypothetical protein